MKQFAFIIGLLVYIVGAAHAQTTIACIGNSITTGEYPHKLQSLLGSAYDVHREGHWGASTYSFMGFAEFDSIFRIKPNIITIKLGMNDRGAGFDSSRYRIAMSQFIDTFRTISPQPMIFLCCPSPAFPLDSTDGISKKMMPTLIDLAAKRNCGFVDFYTPLKDHPECVRDGIHPFDGCGIDTMGNVLFRAISGKPIMQVADSMLTFVFSDAASPQSKTTHVVNLTASTTTLGAVTATKRAPWLGIAVNSSSSADQIVTVTADGSSLTDGVYDDTVILANASALLPIQQLRIRLIVQPSTSTTDAKSRIGRANGPVRVSHCSDRWEIASDDNASRDIAVYSAAGKLLCAGRIAGGSSFTFGSGSNGIVVLRQRSALSSDPWSVKILNDEAVIR